MGKQELRAMEEAEADNDIWNDDIIIENNAVLTIDYDKKQLVVMFDGDRNAVMEFRSDEELTISKTVLADPNFWANFLSTFSAALGKTEGTVGQ